ncbi:MAG: hypothetical protein ACFFCM_08550 [Promethearchaeota archaeon]
MNKEILIENVVSLFEAIIDTLNPTDKEKRIYRVIIPDFSIPNQIMSKRIKMQDYMNDININLPFLEKYSEFHILNDFINTNCELNRDLIEKLIVELFTYILHICREKSCEKKIEKLVDFFYTDITKSPFIFHIKSYITGISLEDEKYELAENLSLRKANSLDFKCMDIGEYSNELNNYSFQFPPVILKFEYHSNINIENYQGYHRLPELLKELLFIDCALLFFKSAPVFRIKTKSKFNSLLMRGETISGGNSPIKTSEKYTINKENIDDLKRVINLFQSQKIRRIFEISPNKPNHINIALNRYQNAYIYSENVLQKITSLISCLEALLSEGAQELKRRLSQRVSIVLKAIEFNPLIVSEEINIAYGIRNKYSHGGSINLKNIIKRNLNDFIRNLIEYTRLCFLISMQIYPLKSKREFLRLIDRSLLDENSYLELVKLINDNCYLVKDQNKTIWER